MNSKLLDLLGLCKRAGFLICGFDMVKEEISKNNNGVLIFARDISLNTKNKFMKNECVQNVIDIDLSKSDIENRIGRYSGILYVNNSGLAKKVISEYNER